MQARDRLRVAVQKKGRLADKSLDLFRKAGLRLVNDKNDLFFRAANAPIDFMMVRDDDIPTFVARGVCDLGIVGRNVLEEWRLSGASPSVATLMALGFGVCTLKIAAPSGWDFQGATSIEGARIATSFPNLVRRYLKENDVQAIVVEMSGAVELAPRLGVADIVADLVSTGQTLEANGLRAVETLLESEALLIRSAAAFPPALEEATKRIETRIAGVMATEETKYIMLNAPEDSLADIAEILPGAEAPTIIPLAGEGGRYAVHAVCKESIFWETLERLKAAGASAILVLPIEKMLM